MHQQQDAGCGASFSFSFLFVDGEKSRVRKKCDGEVTVQAIIHLSLPCTVFSFAFLFVDRTRIR
jgi:hypothetical protein